MIPPFLYRTDKASGIQYVTYAQIAEFHGVIDAARFDKWFTGQTGIITENGDTGIYVFDYERWAKQRSKK